MKRRDLIKKIEGDGGTLLRHGGRHDWYRNVITGACAFRLFIAKVTQKRGKRIMKYNLAMLTTALILLSGCCTKSNLTTATALNADGQKSSLSEQVKMK